MIRAILGRSCLVRDPLATALLLAAVVFSATSRETAAQPVPTVRTYALVQGGVGEDGWVFGGGQVEVGRARFRLAADLALGNDGSAGGVSLLYGFARAFEPRIAPYIGAGISLLVGTGAGALVSVLRAGVEVPLAPRSFALRLEVRDYTAWGQHGFAVVAALRVP